MPYAGRSGGRHSRVKFAFFAIVLLGGILQAPAEAQMHSSGMGMGTVMVQGHPHLVPSDLANKINSQDWTGLTASQLAKAGIYPGMSSANGAPKATVKPRTVQRQSAFGCTANVCIYVFGQGTYVSDWDTSAANGYGYFCSFAATTRMRASTRRVTRCVAAVTFGHTGTFGTTLPRIRCCQQVGWVCRYAL
jgi:hypothetical protein